VQRDAPLPWTEHDWRGEARAEQETRLQAFLSADRELGFDLAAAPLSRVALLRVADDACHMIWTTHHLHVDGWSWPLIFADLGRCYDAERQGGAAATEPACAYRRYIEWLSARAVGLSEPFWRQRLRGFKSPTPLEFARAPEPFGVETVRLSSEDTRRLQAFCREHQLTLNTLVQAAWAMLLGHLSAEEDVVFGAAFSGRPAEIAGIEAMVGPCVSNVPIRIALRGEEPFVGWLSAVQQSQFEAAEHQYVPLHRIQDWSEVPPRYRLFDSLLVFQNYVADDATRRLGSTVSIEALSSPDATNYPLTLVVNPGPELRLKLMQHGHRVDRSVSASVLRELCALLARCAQAARGEGLADVMRALSPQTKGIAARRQRLARVAQPQAGLPASDMERKVAAVWEDLFQVEAVSFDENFFDLGGHSLLLIRAHQRLRESVRPDLSLVAMLQYPTVRTLARHLAGEKDSTAFAAIRERALRQRGAFAQRRGTTTK
jgi:hypothetical protein